MIEISLEPLRFCRHRKIFGLLMRFVLNVNFYNPTQLLNQKLFSLVYLIDTKNLPTAIDCYTIFRIFVLWDRKMLVRLWFNSPPRYLHDPSLLQPIYLFLV